MLMFLCKAIKSHAHVIGFPNNFNSNSKKINGSQLMLKRMKSICQNRVKYVKCKQGLEKKIKTKLRPNIRDRKVTKDQMRKCQKDAKEIGPNYKYI